MPKAPHVALLIETSRAYGRGLLQGINGYLRAHGPWSIYFQPYGLGTRRRGGCGTGPGTEFSPIDDRQMAATIRQTGLPAVPALLRPRIRFSPRWAR